MNVSTSHGPHVRLFPVIGNHDNMVPHRKAATSIPSTPGVNCHSFPPPSNAKNQIYMNKV